MPKVLLGGNISNKREKEKFYVINSNTGPNKAQIKRQLRLKLASEFQDIYWPMESADTSAENAGWRQSMSLYLTLN